MPTHPIKAQLQAGHHGIIQTHMGLSRSCLLWDDSEVKCLEMLMTLKPIGKGNINLLCSETLSPAQQTSAALVSGRRQRAQWCLRAGMWKKQLCHLTDGASSDGVFHRSETSGQRLWLDEAFAWLFLRWWLGCSRRWLR